jgi:HSP20 family protein
MEDRTMYRSLFPRDVFAEFDRLQRDLQGSRKYQECRSNSWHDLQQAFDISPSIRGLARGGYPAMNVGTTPQSVEVFCFAPGVDPNSIDVNIERGVLTIAGERNSDLPSAKDQTSDKVNLHIDERFVGKFRRVVTLPDDVDPDAVKATYRDGVLHVSVQRRQAAQPRRITIQ